jgi:hypothetical protein
LLGAPRRMRIGAIHMPSKMTGVSWCLGFVLT